MPFDGNGNFIRLHNWTQDAANSIDISANEMDQEDDGFASGLSSAVTRDGQGKPSADFLPDVDNLLNLGSATFRWKTINGLPIGTFNNPTQAFLGSVLWPQSQAEINASVVPAYLGFPWGDLRRYGAKGDGSTDDSAAAVIANSVGIVWVSGELTYVIGASVTITAPMVIDQGATLSVSPGFNLTINGLLRIRTATPFTGNGGVNFGTLAKPGRLSNVLFDRAAGVPFYSSAPFYSFGDSYTAGTGATAATCWAAITAARFNGVFTNLGVSGTGVTKTMTQAFANLPKFHARGRSITWMAGFNDLHYYGNNGPTMQKIQDVSRAFLANAFLKTAVPTSDASVTKTAAWTNATAGVWGDKASAQLGGNAMFSAVSTARLDFTFTGESIVVGTWNGNGSTYAQGAFDVYIDSVFIETHTPLGASDGNLLLPDTYQGLSHTALVYTGLGSGSHTISIFNKTANIMMFDYFGTLAAPGECPSVLVGEICHVNAAGYAGPEVNRSKTIDDIGTANIQTSVALFALLGYPVAMVPCNDYYNANTNIFTDNDHPGPAGHVQLSRGFSSRAFPAPALPLIGCNLIKNASQSIPNATETSVTWTGVIADNEGFWNSANPSRIVAPFTGVMRLSGGLGFATNGTGTRAIDVYLNGSGAAYRNVVNCLGQLTASDQIVNFVVDVTVNVGDYVEIRTSQNSGGALNCMLSTTNLDVLMIR